MNLFHCQCKRKHILLCPKFTVTGECPNPGKCTLHHQKKTSSGSRMKPASDPSAKHLLPDGVRIPKAFRDRQKKSRLTLMQCENTSATEGITVLATMLLDIE